MLFGLKNLEAAYRQEMAIIFHNMLHITMEDYVDEILTQSIKRKDNLANLAQIFGMLEEYNLCLNPKKYVFGVTSRNFLG